MERDALEGVSYARSTYEAGGDVSIEQVIEDHAAVINWQVGNGWPRK